MEVETYGLIKHSLRNLLRINLDHYKDEQMKRRLDSWLVRAGGPSWPEYLRRLRVDEPELARLRDYLTINVSAFFRDLERWQTLRDAIVPALLNGRLRLNAWSAGCSIGLEAYSLAMLLDEATPGHRHSLLATDLDRGALARARARGPYSADDVQNVSAARRQRYFEPGGPPHFVQDALARRVTFREQDLLTDAFDSGYDLIICRNVVIYFTEAAKAELYRKFHQALRPGGVLFVGGTEIVPQAQAIGFRSAGISFYQRV